ncbi:transcription elongation factor GreA [Peredibacter starrii]|uniref:Transcription elongation factor GreA n=1 Tax=Peredibacter starrii TaxID=28202 RepID=A0AAX4HQR1_9BACT|nr:transcription elongation factor GreA [Peredibacter starrii]WPU65576.1 transcription elongation factor GreA [Peredibacter starrii]
MSDCPMTLKGRKLLEDELSHLIRVEREQIKQAISEARDLGDLKENAEYAAAKERQSIIEGRILDVQSKIARARVIDVATLNTDKIVFGATVTIFDNQKEVTFTYQIVGEDEAMTDPNKISYNSPLGRALIGKENGDEVIVKAPKGDLTYEVQDVKYS